MKHVVIYARCFQDARDQAVMRHKRVDLDSARIHGINHPVYVKYIFDVKPEAPCSR
jgi:hypothetical protein